MSTPSLLNIPYLYKAGTLYSQIPESGAGDFTVSRTTTVANRSTRINKNGLIELVADNVPRLDYPLGGAVNGCPALLVEPSAVNLALHSRDLTQAAWVASGITPLRNAVGMDGAANTGTTLTATGANGTILQTLTHASQVRAFSAYVRRTVGTGTIEITTNGGTTWTPITLTSAYTRFSTTATVTNGQVGFRIVTSGDAIVVDYCQGEVGTVATSAIPTTTAAVTRNTETIANTSATALIGQSEGTLYWDIAAVAGVLSGTGNPMFGVRNSATTNWVSVISNSPSSPFRIAAQATTGNLINYIANITSGKAALAWSSAGLALYVNGSLVATSATNPNFSFSVAEFVGYAPFKANAFAIYPNRIPNTAAPGVLSLATLTAP